jgi:sulfofructosephosphate aldolase
MPRPDLDALARPSGTFAMLALDQRESLRTIIAERTGRSTDAVPDDELRTFKVDAARALSPVASAILLDVDLGLEPVRAAGAIAPGCGLIIAADALVQAPGGPVEDTALDDRVTASVARDAGAAALKLLVLWHGDERGAVVELAHRFVARAHDADLLAVLEPVVRPSRRRSAEGWDREASILAAADALGAVGADLYKAEVPFHGRGDTGAIAARCRELGARIAGPWVVLSQGVELADFPGAVEAACRGGASGFLAGRAIWTDSIVDGGGDRMRDRLAAVARPRLAALGELVDRVGRPWRETAATG